MNNIEDLMCSIMDEFKGYTRYKKLAEECDDEILKQKYYEIAEQEKSHFDFWHNLLREKMQ